MSNLKLEGAESALVLFNRTIRKPLLLGRQNEPQPQKYRWWFRNPARKPPGMLIKPDVNHGDLHSQPWTGYSISPDFWLPSNRYLLRTGGEKNWRGNSATRPASIGFWNFSGGGFTNHEDRRTVKSTPRKTNECPLKINGWFRCISYWKVVPF